MDRSLWLLLWLRANSGLRRWGRTLRTLKGAMLGVVGVLVFLPTLVTMLFAPGMARPGLMRRYGPLGLLTYCLLNVLVSSGDRAVYYSPGEVNFLFSGPFRPRQLLLYKVIGGLCAATLTALMMTFFFAHHASMWIAAYIGLFLALVLLYLFSLTVGLLVSTVGAMAFTRGRQVVLLGVLTAIAAALAPLANSAATMPLAELRDRLMSFPTVTIATWPFRPFVDVFAADRFGLAFLVSVTEAIAIDGAFLAAVLAMNSGFMEASAAASAKLYARIQQIRRGKMSTGTIKARFELPMLPWLGGAGPNFWRQLTSASRSPTHLVAVVALFAVPVGTVLFAATTKANEASIAVLAVSMLAGLGVFSPAMVGFDFRPDIGRMEDLKTLPIPTSRLVLGQLLAPVAILCAAEWMMIAAVAIVTRSDLGLLAGAALLALPLNLLLVAIENLYCLWFPFRMAGINSFDFQALGRQLLVLMAKGVTLGVVAGVAGGLGFAVYSLGGQSLTAAIAVSWLVAAGMGLAFLPLVAQAFNQFDVAQTMPE